jgi:preprotein translocase subunit Sss1
MKKNAILVVVGVIAVGAIGFAIFKSIKNAREEKRGEQ